MLILKLKYHISRDFMTFGVEFQFLGGFGVGIAFWDARSMKMMIIVPFYSALGGFGIMLKTYLVLNVGHLLSGQLHTVLLHSDSCTGAARMHTCQTYVPEPDLCTGTGLRRGCRAMCRSRSYALTPGLCTGRSTYADAPDLCRGTGFMQTRRTYADAPVLCAGRILCTGARLVRGRRHCAWAPDLCTCA